MTTQFQLFDGPDAPRPAPNLPEGLRYQPELIGAADEAMFLARVRELPLRAFEFHGYTGKRRVISFGWQYDFAGRQLRKAEKMPEFLLALRATAASFADLTRKPCSRRSSRNTPRAQGSAGTGTNPFSGKSSAFRSSPHAYSASGERRATSGSG